ncbi:SAM-dependent methyltransferase [Jatrophihabitans sp.]|uniref:SAM-dependent methyltransferase n=1 Tax=Jatrophihabitans sp. TaxID=1932789 RepID=UPI002BC2E5E8|nr:SAM-dependent methyltransferase [Jatrophihabitans sp.]
MISPSDTTTRPTDLEQLNALYGQCEDPWHMRSGWQAERRRDLLLSALNHPRYGNTFEPGCAAGELTAGLARRSDRVLAADDNRPALAKARVRAGHLCNVELRWMQLPEQWPTEEKFDLIVLHQVGYRLDLAAWAELATAARNSLARDATVLACHHQHEFAERILDTQTLHGILDSILGLPRQTQVIDSDFVIDVWTNRSAQPR